MSTEAKGRASGISSTTAPIAAAAIPPISSSFRASLTAVVASRKSDPTSVIREHRVDLRSEVCTRYPDGHWSNL